MNKEKDPTSKKLGTDEIYCSHCANVISKKAVICPKCGVKNELNTDDYVRKEKSIAIILAVLANFWTWIYTYKKDAWKFWLNLILCIITIGIWSIVSWIWAVIDTATKPDEYYEKFPR